MEQIGIPTRVTFSYPAARERTPFAVGSPTTSPTHHDTANCGLQTRTERR
jgi:hypothetical protein